MSELNTVPAPTPDPASDEREYALMSEQQVEERLKRAGINAQRTIDSINRLLEEKLAAG